MPTYPISVSIPRRRLPGKWPVNFVTEWRNRIEDYLNEQAKTEPVVILMYSQIANGTDISREIVKAFLSPLGGGHNGITITNPQLEKETDA